MVTFSSSARRRIASGSTILTGACIPEIDEDLAAGSSETLVELDKDWVPHAEGVPLHPPVCLCNQEPFLGVHASSSYKFIIILPVRRLLCDRPESGQHLCGENYVRAVRGGTGEVKAGANYAISSRHRMSPGKKVIPRCSGSMA